MKHYVQYAILGLTMHDEEGKEIRSVVTASRHVIPDEMRIGDEGVAKIDGEDVDCVLLGIGGYDPVETNGPPTLEEIFNMFNEEE